MGRFPETDVLKQVLFREKANNGEVGKTYRHLRRFKDCIEGSTGKENSREMSDG